MKVPSVVFAALVAVASVEASVTPNQHDPELILGFCREANQPCGKMKRAANAVAEALAEPLPGPDAEPWHIWCWRPGQPCNKAKRDALALAEAVAEAHAAANPHPGAEAEACKSIHYLLRNSVLTTAL